MNGDDREPANDSPLTDEVLKKYARAREVVAFLGRRTPYSRS